MRALLIVASLSIAVGGCIVPGADTDTDAPNGAPTPDLPKAMLAASGTRIKARMLSTADGAKMRVGWFDSSLGMPCSFAHAGDGKLRCIPDLNRDQSAIRVIYDNKNCAGDAIAIASAKDYGPCVNKGSYVSDMAHGVCDPATIVYEAGVEYVGTGAPMYYFSGGLCISQESDTFSLRVAIVADPGTSFVAGSEMVE
jgi:hypothetical protein